MAQKEERKAQQEALSDTNFSHREKRVSVVAPAATCEKKNNNRCLNPHNG